MNKILLTLTIPFFILLVGCTSNAENENNQNKNRNFFNPNDKVNTKYQRRKKLNYPYRLELEDQWEACLTDSNLEDEGIDNLRNSISLMQEDFIHSGIDCSKQKLHTQCEIKNNLSFNSITKNNNTKTTTGNILLLDSIAMSALKTTVLMRKNTFNGYYKFINGKFSSSDYKYKIQKKRYDFYNLYGDYSNNLPLNTYCSNPKFDSLFSYEDYEVPEEDSHGNSVLNLILDMAIERKIVLVNDGFSEGILPSILAEKCSYTRMNESKLTSTLKRKLKVAAQSVIEIIDKENIRFINNSAGITSNIIANEFSKKGCYKRLSRKKANLINKLHIKYYLKRIFEYKNTIVFQAGPNKTRKNMEYNQNYQADCTQFKNRISISSFSQGKFKDIIPQSGSANKDLLGTKSNAYKCTDIYINSFDPTSAEKPFGIGLNGESYYGRYGTSFATPLALAFFSQKEHEYIEDFNQVPTRDELLNYVKGYEENRKLFDPLSYMDFSTCKKYPTYCSSHKALYEKHNK